MGGPPARERVAVRLLLQVLLCVQLYHLGVGVAVAQSVAYVDDGLASQGDCLYNFRSSRQPEQFQLGVEFLWNHLLLDFATANKVDLTAC